MNHWFLYGLVLVLVKWQMGRGVYGNEEWSLFYVCFMTVDSACSLCGHTDEKSPIQDTPLNSAFPVVGGWRRKEEKSKAPLCTFPCSCLAHTDEINKNNIRQIVDSVRGQKGPPAIVKDVFHEVKEKKEDQTRKREGTLGNEVEVISSAQG